MIDCSLDVSSTTCMCAMYVASGFKLPITTSLATLWHGYHLSAKDAGVMILSTTAYGVECLPSLLK